MKNAGNRCRPRGALATVLREPLLHFLVVGVALFLLYGAVNGDAFVAPQAIVVSAARVEALAESFATTWMRPPTPTEIQGLVDDYVVEEVYSREAIALGLDRDDTVIRRRLRQKMEFVSDDLAAAARPTEAQLQAYLAQHADQFARPPQVTFWQVYFSTDRRGDTAWRDAEQLLADLRAGRAPADLGEAGDASLLPRGMRDAAPQEIQNAFGADFAAALAAAPVGQWAGPLQSDFGLHLVQVQRRAAGSAPALVDVRPAVLREWQAEQRRQSKQAFLAALRGRYEIRIERPAGALIEPDGSTAVRPEGTAGR